MIERLKKLPVEIVSPVAERDERSAIVSFKIGEKSAECVHYLREKNIHTACRSNCVRAAVNVFNNKEDIVCLIGAVDDFMQDVEAKS